MIGVLRGSDPVLKDEWVLIDAHYDHLGYGGEGSLKPNVRAIHLGADDNASGTVAALLAAGGPTVVALNRVVVNAGLTTLLVGSSGVNLVTFNDHAHLAGEHADLRTYR